MSAILPSYNRNNLPAYGFSKPNLQQHQTPKQAENKPDSTYSNPTSFGFNANEQGFISPTLNKLAKIPSDVKIHKKTLEQIANYSKNTNSNLNPIEAISKAWNFFSKISKQSKSYTSDGTILGNLTSQYTANKTKQMLHHDDTIKTYSKNQLSTGLSIIDSLTIKEKYQRLIGKNADKNVSKESKSFGIFIDDEYKKNPHGKSKEVKNYHEFLKSQKSFEDYIIKNFGNDYMGELKKFFVENSTISKVFAGKLFDEIFTQTDELNQDFYSQNKNLIHNKPTTNKPQMDFELGQILNLNI